MEKVSVILTTYNSESSIERTINSILNQVDINKFFELELIVIDDCSTDNTLKIINQFDVLLFSTGKNSGGPNKGRNIGLKNVTGDYICIADHDDVWKENRIISLLPYLKNVPIVWSGYTLVNKVNNKNIIRSRTNSEGYVYYKKNQTFLAKFTKSSTDRNRYLGSLMYKKELKNILFEEHFGVVDFDWGLRLLHQRNAIEVCENLFIRYVDNDNLSLNESYRKIDFYYSLMSIENYMEMYPKEFTIAYKKIHGSRARYYYYLGNKKKARLYFSKSGFSLKTALYYITTYVGYSFVKKHFNIFG